MFRWLHTLADRSLRFRCRRLEVQLSRMTLERDMKQEELELLALCTENLRQWIVANTAAASHAAELLGVRPQEPARQMSNGRL